MGPATTEKPKHVRQAPDFIDDALIATLPPEKQSYWANRKAGKNGNPDLTPKPTVFKTPDDVQIGFDNDGKMVTKTRAMRHRKPPTDVKDTKSTHAINKERQKNAPSRQERIRATAKARKARKESYSQSV